MNRIFFGAILLAAALSGDVLASPVEARAAACTECRFDFGPAPRGTLIEHVFPLHNRSDRALRISGVQLTPPLQLARMPAVVAPGQSAMLKLSLDTSALTGEYNGELLVAVGDVVAPQRAFSFSGTVVPAIEVLPRPAIFLSTAKGKSRSATLDIVNHENKPLALAFQTPPTGPYLASLQTVRPGQRYRLKVTIPASAPAGRSSQRLQLKSSSSAQPIVYIGVHTNVRERVYTFPDVVDFGRLRMGELRSARAAQLGAAQTLMVYQTDGNDFAVTTRSSLPGIGVSSERGPKGDRVQITVSLIAARLAPGLIRGSLRLRSNDPGFPELIVPVTGEILAD